MKLFVKSFNFPNLKKTKYLLTNSENDLFLLKTSIDDKYFIR
jgi:hypothetical protein